MNSSLRSLLKNLVFSYAIVMGLLLAALIFRSLECGVTVEIWSRHLLLAVGIAGACLTVALTVTKGR